VEKNYSCYGFAARSGKFSELNNKIKAISNHNLVYTLFPDYIRIAGTESE
jgi:hypothetical protein